MSSFITKKRIFMFTVFFLSLTVIAYSTYRYIYRFEFEIQKAILAAEHGYLDLAEDIYKNTINDARNQNTNESKLNNYRSQLVTMYFNNASNNNDYYRKLRELLINMLDSPADTLKPEFPQDLHFKIAISYWNESKLDGDLKKKVKAYKWLLSTLSIMENYSKISVRLSSLYLSLGQVSADYGDYDKSKMWFEKSIAIAKYRMNSDMIFSLEHIRDSNLKSSYDHFLSSHGGKSRNIATAVSELK